MANYRHHIGNALLVLIALVVGIVLAEGAAQVYAYKVAKLGKLFRPDHELGWSLLPNLDLVRNNHDREPWLTRTDENGLRGPSRFSEDASRRMLILGDSFVFGEGVNIEERFDTLITERFPDLSIVNLGVMGYGTDQQAIRLRAWKDQLRSGDLVLVLTYSNDFFDVASTRHSGRSKPWFALEEGELVEYGPSIGILEQVRDRSYLLAKLAGLINVNDQKDYETRLARAGELYERIVADEIAGLTDEGIEVLLVHHGDHVFDMPFDVDEVFVKTCAHVTSCLALDPYTATLPRDEIFLSDGHWAAGGHKVAAERIGDHLAARFNPRTAKAD
ncbi:MAG: hypothetical protein OEU92_25420 [Alphaproteobacteria bacterium]|nr:hypothetical protein [Alphaproteobacteria bacterium]